MDSLFPELSFIGDFHSHQYSEFHGGVRSELDLERNWLYRFSVGDFRAAKLEQDEEKTTGLVLLLLSFNVTILLPEATNIWTRGAVLDFSMMVWVKVYVWFGDYFRRKSDKMVRLICPGLGFSLAD